MTNHLRQQHHDYVQAIVDHQDQEAFRALFDYYAPRIHAYLLRLCHNPALAEDITQDVMTTLWKKAGLFDSKKSSLITWLFRVARNRHIDLHRRKRFQHADIDMTELVDEDIKQADAHLDDALREEKVRQAIHNLPIEQLELVRMAFFTDMSHSQIAEETGIALGTVKSRIRLAFKRMRSELEQDDAIDQLEK
jgi:RNA polymerase sigma factor (sigma-70 family)